MLKRRVTGRFTPNNCRQKWLVPDFRRAFFGAWPTNPQPKILFHVDLHQSQPHSKRCADEFLPLGEFRLRLDRLSLESKRCVTADQDSIADQDRLRRPHRPIETMHQSMAVVHFYTRWKLVSGFFARIAASRPE
jgi:hypothetical protein